MKLSIREQILLVGASIILVVVLFLNNYYFPLKDKISEKEEKLQELRTQLNEKKQKGIMLDQLKEELKSLKKSKDKGKDQLIPSFDEPEILSYINNIIKKNSDVNKMESLSLSDITDNEIYVSADAGLTLNVTYKELKRILDDFENGDYLSSVSSISVSKDEKDKDKDTLNVNMNISFYAREAEWDGTSDYNFMKGNFSKANIFE